MPARSERSLGQGEEEAYEEAGVAGDAAVSSSSVSASNSASISEWGASDSLREGRPAGFKHPLLRMAKFSTRQLGEGGLCNTILGRIGEDTTANNSVNAAVIRTP
jgi:hypothetical protein